MFFCYPLIYTEQVLGMEVTIRRENYVKQIHFYNFFFVSFSGSFLHIFAFFILSSKEQLGKGIHHQWSLFLLI